LSTIGNQQISFQAGAIFYNKALLFMGMTLGKFPLRVKENKEWKNSEKSLTLCV
jgi:hypothetical protein